MKNEKIINEIIKYVPEFKKSDIYKEIKEINSLDLDNIVLSGLADFYLESIKNENKEVVTKIIKFCEDKVKKGDPDMQNLFAVGFFESLESSESTYFQKSIQLFEKSEIYPYLNNWKVEKR